MNRITRISRKGQITIPKEVRDQLGLRPSDAIEVWAEGDEARVRKAPRLTLRDVAGILSHPQIPMEQAFAKAKREHAESRAQQIVRQLAGDS